MKNLFFNCFRYSLTFGLLLLPFQSIFSPTYWKNWGIAPVFYLVSIFLFLVPLMVILVNEDWRNPFFALPFYISFLLSISTPLYSTFLKYYVLFLGLVGVCFCLTRCRPPWQLLEWDLYLTDFFTDFFEVHNFWRISVFIIVPIFIPLIWICSLYSSHH